MISVLWAATGFFSSSRLWPMWLAGALRLNTGMDPRLGKEVSQLVLRLLQEIWWGCCEAIQGCIQSPCKQNPPSKKNRSPQHWDPKEKLSCMEAVGLQQCCPSSMVQKFRRDMQQAHPKFWLEAGRRQPFASWRLRAASHAHLLYALWCTTLQQTEISKSTKHVQFLVVQCSSSATLTGNIPSTV